MNWNTTITRCANEETTLNFIQELGLVDVEKIFCEECGSRLNIERGVVRHGLNVRLRCILRTRIKSVSIFRDTIFAKSHSTVPEILKALHAFACGETHDAAFHECGMARSNVKVLFQNLKAFISIFTFH